MSTNDEPRVLWDVIIVGAGPAGSAAAIASARAGLRVLLVDAKQFPRRKVCGGCLNRVSRGLLSELLGAEHALLQGGLPLEAFELTHRGRVFRYALPAGMAVDRAQLDDSLVRRARDEGVQFNDLTLAKVLPATDDYRQVELIRADGTRVQRAKAVVVASGLGGRASPHSVAWQATSPASSRVGIEAIFERYPSEYVAGTIHMVVAPCGYVGLTQIAGQRLHVAAAVDRRTLQQLGPAQTVQAILRTAGAAVMVEDPSATWRGTPPLTSRAKHVADKRVFLVGDAAAYIEPFTGEGIRWALETGIGVTPLLVRATQAWDDQLIDEWQSWYRQHIAPEQRLCRQLATGLRYSLTRWVAHQSLRWQPRLAQSVISRLNSANSHNALH